MGSPGGVLELEKTPQECAAREVLEDRRFKNIKLGIISSALRCELAGGSAN